MEGLAPPLECLFEIEYALQSGRSIRSGLLRYTESHSARCIFARQVSQFLFDWEQGRDWRKVLLHIKSPYRQALLETSAAGLAGQSIQLRLNELKTEIELACEAEIRSILDLLPLRLLPPLVFFLFPAYLLLLFGPLMKLLLQELQK